MPKKSQRKGVKKGRSKYDTLTRGDIEIHSRAMNTLSTSLDRHSNALESFALKPPGSARGLVYLVFQEKLPFTKINDNTKLSDISVDDGVSKEEIRGRINAKKWHGVSSPWRARWLFADQGHYRSRRSRGALTFYIGLGHTYAQALVFVHWCSRRHSDMASCGGSIGH